MEGVCVHGTGGTLYRKIRVTGESQGHSRTLSVIKLVDLVLKFIKISISGPFDRLGTKTCRGPINGTPFKGLYPPLSTTHPIPVGFLCTLSRAITFNFRRFLDAFDCKNPNFKILYGHLF